MPDVTVIIPCYNGRAHLDRAISSVLNQSYRELTILVVDDASDDGSARTAERYGARGCPVQCVKQVRNGGPATARNVAISRVATPFVAFLDVDDYWEPGHCESLRELLLVHPDAVLAFSLSRSADGETRSAPLPVPTGQPVAMLAALLDDNFIPQSAVMARRDGIVSAGGYTDGMRYSEDYDLWLRMAHRHRFIATSARTCVRTSHAAQATHNSARMYRGAWEARANYIDFTRKEGRVIACAQYQSVCVRAYDRDLSTAWRSRSFRLFRSVLDLSTIVPGGAALSRQWRLRAALYWPIWRGLAWCWDALPAPWKRKFKRVPA